MLENYGLLWTCVSLLVPLSLISQTHAEVAITQEKGITTLWYSSSDTRVATFTFQACEILECPISSSILQSYINSYGEAYICITSIYWGDDCSSWGAAAWNTGESWGYKPQGVNLSLQKRMTITKIGNRMKLAINIENPSPSDQGTYVLGWCIGGGITGHRKRFHIKDMYKDSRHALNVNTFINPLLHHISTFKNMVAISDPTFEDVVAIETGLSDLNLWLE